MYHSDSLHCFSPKNRHCLPSSCWLSLKYNVVLVVGPSSLISMHLFIAFIKNISTFSAITQQHKESRRIAGSAYYICLEMLPSNFWQTAHPFTATTGVHWEVPAEHRLRTCRCDQPICARDEETRARVWCVCVGRGACRTAS